MKQRDIVILVAPLSILVLIWVGATVYQSSVTSTISEKLNIQIIPIAPTFNTTIINSLKKRQSVSGQFKPQPLSPTPSSAVSATSAASTKQSSSSAVTGQ